jgi:hypothetical protein
MGIGIEADAACIGILAFSNLVSPVLEHSGTGLGVRIRVPGWFQHGNFFNSGTGIIRCRTVRR